MAPAEDDTHIEGAIIVVYGSSCDLGHHQQVMSPNPLDTPQPMHDTQQAAAAEASARNDATDTVMFRSMAQIASPADLLRKLQETAIEDIRAAMQ